MYSNKHFCNRHASEKTKLLQEINNLKELLNTYEKSIERKDQVISNLTGALQKQKDKNEMMKKFCDWKIKHNDLKREVSVKPNHEIVHIILPMGHVVG